MLQGECQSENEFEIKLEQFKTESAASIKSYIHELLRIEKTHFP